MPRPVNRLARAWLLGGKYRWPFVAVVSTVKNEFARDVSDHFGSMSAVGV